ncbi:ESPR-type extended signal peptide-containing protein, partial [Acinetobacter rathckeae]|uniref:ESPR-type extended signal peptide-containing protein n=1 Tax=Acinetobacter rathckeae TaxID=2605272 RepID=UPI00224BAA80
MNKVYKVVWNVALGAWCAVSELGKSKKKSTRAVVGTTASLVLLTISQTSFAGYTAGGGTYCSGAGTNPYGAVAIGGNSDAPCAVGAATAIGNAAKATADSSTAIGSGAQATAKGSTAIGNDSQATAIGALAVTTGDGSGSSKGNASGKNSIIIGTSVNASAEGAIAIGANSSATVANGVALGSGSASSTASGIQGYDALTGANSTATSTTWQSNLGAISVGNGTTTTRQITSVAAGQADTDAVNVAQLKQAKTYSSNIANSLKTVLGGNAAVATNGTVSTSNIGGTGTDTVEAAVASVKSSATSAQTAANTAQATADKGLNFRANTDAADKVALGETVTFANGTNTTATYDASSNTYKYSVVDAPTFAGQVTAKGINASNAKVTGIAAGTVGSSSTDAVNGAQVRSISDSTATLLGGNAAVGSDGTVTTSDIGGTGQS